MWWSSPSTGMTNPLIESLLLLIVSLHFFAGHVLHVVTYYNDVSHISFLVFMQPQMVPRDYVNTMINTPFAISVTI